MTTSVVKQLPSKHRSYKKDTIITTRGLLFAESKKLARMVDKDDIESLAELYKDVIGGIDVMDLELVDFSLLLIISSIWTVDNFSWNPKIICNNLLEDREVCGGDTLTRPIVLDDLDFDTQNIVVTDHVDISINNGTEGWAYKPMTVRRKIELDRYISYLDENSEDYEDEVDFAKLASLIVNTDDSELPELSERVKLIKNSTTKEIEELAQIDAEMVIRINPVECECAKCHKSVRVRVGIESLRRVPHL